MIVKFASISTNQNFIATLYLRLHMHKLKLDWYMHIDICLCIAICIRNLCQASFWYAMHFHV